MATSGETTPNEGKLEIATLEELVAILKAGPIPQGLKASPALLEYMEGTIKRRTSKEAIELFEAVERKFPHKTLGDDKWYLVVVSREELYFKESCLRKVAFRPHRRRARRKQCTLHLPHQ